MSATGSKHDGGDLTRFKTEILYALADIGPVHGLGVKDSLEDLYERVHHGRLYPNLDDLIERGLVEKDSVDGRTNEYRLTSKGEEYVRRDAQRRMIAAEGLGGEE